MNATTVTSEEVVSLTALIWEAERANQQRRERLATARDGTAKHAIEARIAQVQGHIDAVRAVRDRANRQ